jgi:hypothetical protein
MIKHLLSFTLLFFVYSCSTEPQAEQETNIDSKNESSTSATTADNHQQEPSQYSLAVFLCDSSNQKSGYGYNIIMDSHVFIHQPSVPSVPGNKGFTTKEQAEKVASFVVYKLTHNIMPPSVTPKELDSLGILK